MSNEVSLPASRANSRSCSASIRCLPTLGPTPTANCRHSPYQNLSERGPVPEGGCRRRALRHSTRPDPDRNRVRDGSRLTLNFQGSGDVFGEISGAGRPPRTADAIAAEPSELFVLRRGDFMAYLEREPKSAVKLIELLWHPSGKRTAGGNRCSAAAGWRGGSCPLAEDFGRCGFRRSSLASTSVRPARASTVSCSSGAATRHHPRTEARGIELLNMKRAARGSPNE